MFTEKHPFYQPLSVNCQPPVQSLAKKTIFSLMHQKYCVLQTFEYILSTHAPWASSYKKQVGG